MADSGRTVFPAGSGGITDILEIRRNILQPIDYNEPDEDGTYVNTIEVHPIHGTITRHSGDAIAVNLADTIPITYVKGGVYLHQFTMTFLATEFIDGPGLMQVSDYQWLYDERETSVRFTTVSFSWMTSYQDGDVNKLPQIDLLRTKRPLGINQYHYITIKAAD